MFSPAVLSQCDIKKAVGDPRATSLHQGWGGWGWWLHPPHGTGAGGQTWWHPRDDGIPEMMASLPLRQRGCPQGRMPNESSLSLSSPTQLALLCISEIQGRDFSSGKRTGPESRTQRWQVSCSGHQSTWLVGCGRCRFRRVCVAANATLLREDGKEKAALQEEQTESWRLLQGQEEEEQLRDASQARSTRVAQDVHIQVC